MTSLGLIRHRSLPTSEETTGQDRHQAIMSETIKAVSYNVHSCVGADGRYSIERIARSLGCQNPDIVCLQEVEANGCLQKTRLWSETHGSHQPDEIAAHLNFAHVRFAPALRSVATGRFSERHDGDDGRGGFGIATLSRFPIVRQRVHAYAPYREKTPRNALACLVELAGGTTLWVVNTHLGCHSGGEQYQQATELSEFIDSLESPVGVAGVILCGDFNSLPFFRSVQVLESGGMVDAHKEKGVGSGCTFPSTGLPGMLWCPFSRPIFRLDYIFMKLNHPDGIVLDRVEVVKRVNGNGSDEMASDHLPLCAVFVVAG